MRATKQTVSSLTTKALILLGLIFILASSPNRTQAADAPVVGRTTRRLAARSRRSGSRRTEISSRNMV